MSHAKLHLTRQQIFCKWSCIVKKLYFCYTVMFYGKKPCSTEIANRFSKIPIIGKHYLASFPHPRTNGDRFKKRHYRLCSFENSFFAMYR